MSIAANLFFDTFTGEEADLMKTIMAELKDVPWAKPILQEIDTKGGLCAENRALFFELRMGHALHHAGMSLAYETPGEGASTLDFGFTSQGQPWNIELLRLEETAAVQAATGTRTDASGTQWTDRLLSGTNEDKRQTLEGETIKAVQRICQKCEKDGRPYKFTPPSTAINALIVDMRSFNSGHCDDDDVTHIAHGGEAVRPESRLYWGEPPTLISGAFSPRTTVKGAPLLRDRVHFLGFARERIFAKDAMARSILFIANPHLLPDQTAADAAFASWPLKLAV